MCESFWRITLVFLRMALFLHRMRQLKERARTDPYLKTLGGETALEQARRLHVKTHRTLRELFGSTADALPPLTIVPMTVGDTNSATTRPNRPDLDPLLPQPPFVWLFPTQRESGKTTIIANLLTRPDMYYRWFDRVIVFCSTLERDDKWKSIHGYPYITDAYTIFNPAELQRLVLEQEEECKWHKKAAPNRLFVFDDEAFEGYLHCDNKHDLASQLLSKLVTTGRHNKDSVLMTTQCFKKLGTDIRRNATHVTVLAISNGDDLDALYESYGATLKRPQFNMLYHEAMKELPGDEHSFWHLETKQVRSLEKRFRRNFTEFQPIPTLVEALEYQRTHGDGLRTLSGTGGTCPGPIESGVGGAGR